tara:strand:+ start:22612 stop:22839 length:228 start_codon:yes stop_codon:yes gene_type:complete
MLDLARAYACEWIWQNISERAKMVCPQVIMAYTSSPRHTQRASDKTHVQSTTVCESISSQIGHTATECDGHASGR